MLRWLPGLVLLLPCLLAPATPSNAIRIRDLAGPYSFRLLDWETVDGIPTRTDGTCPNYEPGGWRHGETDSGDNVGRWPSIQMSKNDKPMR